MSNIPPIELKVSIPIELLGKLRIGPPLPMGPPPVTPPRPPLPTGPLPNSPDSSEKNHSTQKRKWKVDNQLASGQKKHVPVENVPPRPQTKSPTPCEPLNKASATNTASVHSAAALSNASSGQPTGRPKHLKSPIIAPRSSSGGSSDSRGNGGSRGSGGGGSGGGGGSVGVSKTTLKVANATAKKPTSQKMARRSTIDVGGSNRLYQVPPSGGNVGASKTTLKAADATDEKPTSQKMAAKSLTKVCGSKTLHQVPPSGGNGGIGASKSTFKAADATAEKPTSKKMTRRSTIDEGALNRVQKVPPSLPPNFTTAISMVSPKTVPGLPNIRKLAKIPKIKPSNAEPPRSNAEQKPTARQTSQYELTAAKSNRGSSVNELRDYNNSGRMQQPYTATANRRHKWIAPGYQQNQYYDPSLRLTMKRRFAVQRFEEDLEEKKSPLAVKTEQETAKGFQNHTTAQIKKGSGSAKCIQEKADFKFAVPEPPQKIGESSRVSCSKERSEFQEPQNENMLKSEEEHHHQQRENYSNKKQQTNHHEVQVVPPQMAVVLAKPDNEPVDKYHEFMSNSFAEIVSADEEFSNMTPEEAQLWSSMEARPKTEELRAEDITLSELRQVAAWRKKHQDISINYEVCGPHMLCPCGLMAHACESYKNFVDLVICAMRREPKFVSEVLQHNFDRD